VLCRSLAAALAMLAIAASPAAAASPGGRVDAYLQSIRHDRARLTQFMRALPKGGDIHNHLSGAVYAEALVGFAARDGLCLDVFTLVVSRPPCAPGMRSAADLVGDNGLYNRVIAAWSMRGFTPGVESGHDHFFATFDKFDAALDNHEGDGLAEVATRAASQHEHYLETLITPAFGATVALARQVGFDGDFAATRQRLLDAGIVGVAGQASEHLDRTLAQFRANLQCGTSAAGSACALPIRFDVQVLRAMPPEVVFAYMVMGFELMQRDGRFVGINLVQPEDDIVALRDYRLQMAMLDYLRGVYPRGHITLHAGELVRGLVPPADLRFHIRAAIEQGHAERIGHGVDIREERAPEQLAAEMRRRDILVEQPLVSNAQILGVLGRRSPFLFYRRHEVPQTLATDDEGVSRTDLTEQYLLAFREYKLHYADLVRLSENSLAYGFLAPADKRAAQASLDADFARFERRFGHGG
jgi:adenosine deaminase